MISADIKETGDGKGCGCFLLIATFNLVLGGFATQYVVEYWGTYLKEAPVDIPFWVCAIAGFFVGQITVPAAIITWLLSFVL